jgi:hypothetical protein
MVLLLAFFPSIVLGQTIPVLLQANEKGVTITVYPNASGPAPSPINLSTATQILLRASGPTPVGIENFTMTSSEDGSYATYVTQSEDFPLPGYYQLELIVVFGSSQTLRSPIQTIQVGQTLPGSP